MFSIRCISLNPVTPTLLVAACVLALLTPHAYSQEVYKTVDKDGKIIYSDKPQDEDSVEVDVKLKNVQPPVDFRKPLRTSRPEEEKAIEYTVSMQNPADGAQIGPAQNSLKASVSVSPRLKRSHAVQFYFDGTPMGSASSALSATMPLGLKQRGKRQLSAAVLDENGNVLGRSASHTVYVIRP